MKWRYRVKTVDGSAAADESALNNLGEDGWELVGVAIQGPKSFLYLKQPCECKVPLPEIKNG